MSNPGSEFPRVPVSAMKPGDIVLSRGQDPASDFVARLDGGIYSHAAVWTGEAIVEAIPDGVQARPLQKTFDEQAFVDVYRWKKSVAGKELHLGDEGYPAQPVVDCAMAIAQEHMVYSFDELILGAIIIWTSKMPANKDLRIAVRILGDLIDPIVHRWALAHGGKEGMVCSQVVTTSYWEASEDRRYEIDIDVDGDGRIDRGGKSVANAGGASEKVPEAHEYEKTVARIGDALARLSYSPRGVMAPAGSPLVPLGVVTPRELQESPNLELVGRISDKPLKHFESLSDDLKRAIEELLEMKAESWLKGLLPKLWRKIRRIFGGH